MKFGTKYKETLSKIFDVNKLLAKKTSSKYQSNNEDSDDVKEHKEMELNQLKYDLDNISHWVCRLANIHGNMVDWFVRNETLLYQGKLFKYVSLFPKEKQIEIHLQIIKKYYEENGYFLKKFDDGRDQGIIVPFEDVATLIVPHMLIIRRGFVRLTNDKLPLLIKSLYKRNLWVSSRLSAFLFYQLG